MIFNDNVDAALALFFMVAVLVVIAASAREWNMILSKRQEPKVHESPYVLSKLDLATE